MTKQILFLSPSSANLYLTCPLLYHHKDVKLKNDKLLDFGSWIHDVIKRFSISDKNILAIAKSTFITFNIDLDDYLRGKKMLEEFLQREYLNFKTLDVEVKLEDILDNGVALRGIADRIVERDKDTIEIIDYKSGGKYYSINILNKNMQLKIYANLIRNHPKYKKYSRILLTIDPLMYKPITIEPNDEDNESFLEWISEVYLKISKDKKFEPNFPNSFCKNCTITNLCSPYKTLLKYNLKIRNSLKNKAEHFYELKKIKPIIEKDIGFYKEFFQNHLTAQSQQEIEIANYTVGIKNNRLWISRRNKK